MSRVQLCATTRSTTAGSKTVGLPLRRRPQPAPRRSLATPRPRLRGSALGRHGTAAGRGPRSSGPPRAARPRSGLAQRGRALQCCRRGSADGVVRWRSGLEQRRRTRRPCSPSPSVLLTGCGLPAQSRRRRQSRSRRQRNFFVRGTYPIHRPTGLRQQASILRQLFPIERSLHRRSPWECSFWSQSWRPRIASG